MSPAYLEPVAARRRYERLVANADQGDELAAKVWLAIGRRLRACAARVGGELAVALTDRGYDAECRAARTEAREAAVVDQLRRVLGMPAFN